MAHRVYHWKHGWIPLDHMAALSKAKGSDAGARRYLAQSHASGHAHGSVVEGSYGGGTHVRGLQPVAAEHLRRDRRITTAFNPDSRRFALHDPAGRTGLSSQGPVATSIPEHLAEHINARGHKITGLTQTTPANPRVVVTTRDGSLKSFKADGSDINQVDQHVVEPPVAPSGHTSSASDATRTYVASHNVTVGQHGVGGRRYGVIKPVNGMGGLDIINAGVADRINERGYKVIGFERKVITTVGPDGVIRRFKADGSNVDKPVIAKAAAGSDALRDIGDWKALTPSTAIPTTGPRPVNGFKVQRAYRRGNKTVLIESKLSEAEAEAFLNHVGQAFDATGHHTSHEVTVHVPSGDRNFASGRTRGYVYRGDSTRVHVAPSVAKESINTRERNHGAGGFYMAGSDEVHPTVYTLTHELGHIADNKHGHTFQEKGAILASGGAGHIHRENRDGLSRYGRTNAAEGYAEAFAHHHLRDRNKSTGDRGHDTAASNYANHYGWQTPGGRWNGISDADVLRAYHKDGDQSARVEARRRGIL